MISILRCMKEYHSTKKKLSKEVILGLYNDEEVQIICIILDLLIYKSCIFLCTNSMVE